MPAPDQVRDDGSGIQLRKEAKQYWIPVEDPVFRGCVAILKIAYLLIVMPDSIRHPAVKPLEKHWIPGQARNDERVVSAVLVIMTQSNEGEELWLTPPPPLTPNLSDSVYFPAEPSTGRTLIFAPAR